MAEADDFRPYSPWRTLYHSSGSKKRGCSRLRKHADELEITKLILNITNCGNWSLVLKLARADFPHGLSRSSDAASLRSRGIINISMILGEVRCSSNSERQRKREVFLMLPGARSGRLDNLYLEINK